LVPALPHLTSCTPTICNLCLDSSSKTVIREPALCRFLMFQVPYLISKFCSLCCLPKESVQVLGSLGSFGTVTFFCSKGLLALPWATKLEAHPLSAICSCLFSVFAAILHTWRPSPQLASWGCTMMWWQGSTWYGFHKSFIIACWFSANPVLSTILHFYKIIARTLLFLLQLLTVYQTYRDSVLSIRQASWPLSFA
jgi:hypothetical protein